MAVPPEALIDVRTSSTEMPDWQQLPAPAPPTITMNGAAFAQLPPAALPNGWQLVVLNATGDLTSPANILQNEYIYLQGDNGSWASTYGWMYQEIVRAVLLAGNVEQQLVLLASYGLDASMAPTVEALEFLLARGAGATVQKWETTVDVGSQGSGWVDTPASYIFLGGTAYGYGQGYEALNVSGTGPAPAELTVTLANNVPPT